ncbi:serine/threonine-protein phosphatase 7 long form homolog [Rutidosis leptorrhynchoides]|uniref:serine/threonine-protein phosphatase 7 long form homolog n=1 Tax=Rutidosis leptorrhynchoides TaxID=125765 RepID=UPI003A99568B
MDNYNERTNKYVKLFEHISGLQNETIDERVQVYLDNVGLGLVCRLGKQILDWSLFIAMVERWRPETHTFHLPIGIAAEAIGDRGIQKGRILLSVLMAELAENVGDTIESHQQRARVYILALMSGVLFSDSNAYDVPLSLLHTIIDLSSDRRISWGSAVLAHLYRNLCKAATNYEVKAINGALLLVQQWVYERIPSIALILKNDVRIIPVDLPPNQIPLIRAPYGSRWHGKRTNKNTSAHVLSTYRSLLAALKPRQFIWQPYDLLLSRLPRQCIADRALWSYRGAIILATIETHLPNRVCRHADLRAIVPHVTYIGQWNDRANRLFVGRDGGGVSRDYYDWYKARTVVHITDPEIDDGTNTYPNWAGTTNVYEEGL